MPIQRGPSTDRSGLAFLPVDAQVYGNLFPCRRCAVWFVTVDRFDGDVVIREWHEESCPVVPADARGPVQ